MATSSQFDFITPRPEMAGTVNSGTGEKFGNKSLKLTNRFNSTRGSRIETAKRTLPFNVNNMQKYSIQSKLSNYSASPKNESPLKKTIEKLCNK